MSGRSFPGFNGERLREARCARGLTAAGLADLIGVGPAAVSHYERGRNAPSIEVMGRISERTHLPLSFFLSQSRPLTPVIRWRSRSKSLASARTRAQQRYEWFRGVVDEIERYIDLPALNLPDPILEPDYLAITNRLIDESATRLRRHWGLGDGPISHVVRLVENHGIVVVRANFDDDRLDAFSDAERSGRCYIVLGTGSGSAARTRFNIAHELAHLALHQGISDPVARQTDAHREIERQAHRFAGAFLLPAATFGVEVRSASLEELVELKSRWRVSLAAMISRLRVLGRIDEQGRKDLMIQLGKRGWRSREVLDDQLPDEQPCMLARSVDLLLASGMMTGSSLAAACRFHVEEVERLLGLPEGRLRDRGDGSPSLSLRDGAGQAARQRGGVGVRLVE